MVRTIESLDVAKLLEEERTKRNLTFEDVGAGLGCSASYVFRIEKGKRKKPSYEIVSKMINFFQLSNQDIQKYINGSTLQETGNIIDLETELINFIKGMNINSVKEVNDLLKRIEKYKSELYN